MPEYIVLIKADDSITHYEGIPSQSVHDAILSCRKTMMPERLGNATREAERQGYIMNEQAALLLKDLGQNDETAE